jgi:ParB-like chromosome segregation protein Spo0J
VPSYHEKIAPATLHQPSSLAFNGWPASAAKDSERDMPSSSWIEAHPVVLVQIKSLVLEGCPRLAGENQAHTRMLADVGQPLPPIVVHEPTLRVIDGAHRVRAALLNDRSEIEARMLACDADMAFVLAVQANVSHGLPLTKADRTLAASRITVDHSDWSDRAIAEVTGLSDKTISRIRRRTVSSAPESAGRVGRDGRLRPLDTTEKREQAAALITERPDSGLREIARATGLSTTTVQDVRQRMNRGQDPVPTKYRPTETARSSEPDNQQRKYRPKLAPVDQQAVLTKLRHDPSLRLSQSGRYLMEWLHNHMVAAGEVKKLHESIPDHWASMVAELARSCAVSWTELADQLDQRSALRPDLHDRRN